MNWTRRVRGSRAPGLVRARILQTLRAALDRPLTLLVAPAGSGKSTALRHLAADLERPTVWYHPNATAADPARLLADLRRVLTPLLERDTGPWDHPRTALDALHEHARGPVLLLVDDLHTIRESPGEAALETVIRGLPDWVRVVAASRHLPGFNVSDLLVSGRAVQVPDDVLRWRPWEVERLFREVYHSRLRPEHAARLTHRTEGWSAGLHLFHLATVGLGPSARERLITELHSTPALVRDYLTRNFLAGLSTDLAEFMVDTCVLGRLDAALCDRLRDRCDSADHLAELQARRLFVVEREDGHGLRYHEVLRSYLEASLLERDGPVEVRRRHLRAGELLEEAGAMVEALYVYVRAEAWDHAEHLLERRGSGVLSEGGRNLLDRLPTAFVESDPWLQLARARVLVGEGRLRRAVEVYLAAERSFGREVAGDEARRELRVVRSWLDPRDRPPRRRPDASELLQAALRGEPQRIGRRAAAGGTANGLLVAAAAMLLAGAVEEARDLAARAATAEDGDLLHLSLARVLEATAAALAGEHGQLVELSEAAESFERLGVPWGARLVRTMVRCSQPHDPDEVAQLWRGIDPDDDPWGAASLKLLGGIASVAAGGTESTWLDEAADVFDDLQAPVLAAWALAWSSVARARQGGDDAELVAQQARTLAHGLQVPGAEALAERALASSGGLRAAESLAHADALAGELGLALPELRGRPPIRVVQRMPPLARVQSFGGLELALDGCRIDLDVLRPQARQVLAMVAVRAPRPVHRDQLGDALWPQLDADTQARRLPVLISTLRRHLEPDVDAGDWHVLVRVGEAYTLRLPTNGYNDVATFEDAIAAARGMQHHDPAAREELLGVAFEAYGGDLLPEFGAAGWVVDDRDHYRMEFVDVAQTLAEIHLRRGEPGRAVELVRHGLRVDRYRSQLWRVLAAAHRDLGDVAAATRADRDHRTALGELGLHPVAAT